ncbi:MAG: regulatory protein RecX [Patescibacteria group bacterium]
MDDLYAKLLQSSIRFVSFRPRSEKEFKYFLLKKLARFSVIPAQAGIQLSVIDRVILRLRDLGYADDAKFVSWWINQRQSHKPKGMRLIAQELKDKGIEVRDLKLDEDVLARQVVAKKLPLWEKLPPFERKKKIYGFLGRRGFDADTIHRVIDGVLDDEIES